MNSLINWQFTTAVSDLIPFCIEEPGKAASAEVGHTLGLGMGGALSKLARVDETVDRGLVRGTGKGRTLIARDAGVAGFVNDRSSWALASTDALPGAEGGGNGAVGRTG